MQVTQALLSEFRAKLAKHASDAQSYVRAYLAAMRQAFPGMSVAECRDYALQAIDDALVIYGNQAVDLAGDWFETLATQEGYATAFESRSVIDSAAKEAKVRWLAGKLVTGDYRGFDGGVSDLTRYYVERSAFSNLVANCDAGGIRYARVPSGTETCAFCFMLASRGFVYHSENLALFRGGTGSLYHQHCDCVVVPGFGDGFDQDAQVEGYTPSQLQKRYWQVLDEDGIRNTSDTDAVIAALESRNARWLFTGEAKSVD